MGRFYFETKGGVDFSMRHKIQASIFSLLLGMAILSQRVVEPSYDSDILWSVAIGKWINIHRTFPVVDSFSWTIYGQEWMTHEWAYAYLAYLMNEAFGSLGFYLLALIPMVFTIYVLYLMAQSYDVNKTYAYLLAFTMGVILIYAVSLPFRAYIFALLFVTLLLYLLYFKEEKEYDFLLYAVLFILWANFQVSVFMGLVILLAEMARKFLLCPSKRLRVLLIAILSVLSTFINPYGYKLWSYFIFVITEMGGHRMIQEWQAVDFNEQWVLFLYLGTAGVILFFQFKYKNYCTVMYEEQISSGSGTAEKPFLWTRILDWVQTLLTRENCLIIGYWCFFIYALYSVRMMMFSLILWTIIVAYFVSKTRRLNFSLKTYYICLLLFVTLMLVNLTDAGFTVKDVFSNKKDVTPIEEVAFLKDNPAYSDHLFNEYMFGAYLILNDIPVFIDARCDSYIKFGILKKFNDIKGLREDPQTLFNELGVKNLLIKDGALKKYIDIHPQWKLVYGGPTAFIYTRTDDQ